MGLVSALGLCSQPVHSHTNPTALVPPGYQGSCSCSYCWPFWDTLGLGPGFWICSSTLRLLPSCKILATACLSLPTPLRGAFRLPPSLPGFPQCMEDASPTSPPPWGHGSHLFLLLIKTGVWALPIASPVTGNCPLQGTGVAGRKPRHNCSWFHCKHLLAEQRQVEQVGS